MNRLGTLALSLGLLGLTATAAAAGELSAADLRKVMAEHGDDVKQCYTRHGMKQRTASGKVVVTAVVAKDGSTRDVSVEAPGVKGDKLERCVASAARSWAFPPIDSPTEVELPFLFQHTHARGAGPARRTR
jgi:TonB family protein